MTLTGLTLVSWKKMEAFFQKLKLLDVDSIVNKVGVPLQHAGSGSFRDVYFLNYNWVVKIPSSHDACIQNIQEYFISRMFPTYFAFCFLYKLNGIPILICERVDKAKDEKDILSTNVLDDGYYQTGYTQDKRFVCYDAGNENDLLNADADTMIKALKEAPELCSYGELIDKIEEDWKQHRPNLPIIPYGNMLSLKSYLIVNDMA